LGIGGSFISYIKILTGTKTTSVSAISSDIPSQTPSLGYARAAVVHLNFRAGSTFPLPVCTVPALWTGQATRLTRSDFMLHIGWIYFYWILLQVWGTRPGFGFKSGVRGLDLASSLGYEAWIWLQGPPVHVAICLSIYISKSGRHLKKIISKNHSIEKLFFWKTHLIKRFIKPYLIKINYFFKQVKGGGQAAEVTWSRMSSKFKTILMVISHVTRNFFF